MAVEAPQDRVRWSRSCVNSRMLGQTSIRASVQPSDVAEPSKYAATRQWLTEFKLQTLGEHPGQLQDPQHCPMCKSRMRQGPRGYRLHANARQAMSWSL